MSGAREAGMQAPAVAVDPAGSGAARVAAHLGVALAGLSLGALAGVVAAFVLGLIQIQC